MSFIYLAGPYSHPDPTVRQRRFEQLNRYAARLMEAGIPMFSPISHSHPIADHMVEDRGHDFWMAMDLPILRHAAGLLVLTLEGWQESRGVGDEFTFAVDHGIPYAHASPTAQTLPLQWCRERLA